MKPYMSMMNNLEVTPMKGLYIKSIPFGKGAAGGGITHTIGIIRGFFETDIDMTVLTSEEFDIQNEKVVDLHVPYNASGMPFVRDYLFFRKYKKAILRWLDENKTKYDFVYCRHRMFSDLPRAIANKLNAFLVLELNDVVYENIWTLALYPNMIKRNALYRPLFHLAGFILKWSAKQIEIPVIQRADKIIVISEQMKQNLIELKLKSEDRILALPNGVDPRLFQSDDKRKIEYREKVGIPADRVVVGFAGTFGNWHGIPELTEAIKKIVQHERISFLLMGDGLMKKDMQKELEQYSNVIFTGLIPFSEMPGYLDCCDILVISNSWDPKFNKPFFGSPTKLFEYMSMGKAIVASRLEQISEILEDNISAMMFTPGDADEMANSIKLLAEDAELRRTIGKNARESVIKNHTWKKNAEIIESVIKSASNKNAEE